NNGRAPDTYDKTVVIYSLTWCFQTLYHTQPKGKRQPPSKISSQMEIYPRTGADESVNILLTFPKSVPAGERSSQAIATGSLRVTHNPGEGGNTPCARIQGTKGEIEVYGMCYEPERFRVIPTKDSGESTMDVKQEFPGGARGMNWEADEVARCLRDGKLESSTMDLEESLVIMKTMDEIRKQGGLWYPEAIETTKLA
ncbi:adenylate kinase, partial [Ascosphaera pollenicola]